MFNLNSLKKFISVFVIIAFTHSQTFAMEKNFEAQVELSDLIATVSNGASSDQIIEKAKNSALEAHNKGVSEQEFLKSVSDKMALELTDEEITESIADMRQDHSKDRLLELAGELENINSEEKVVAVLLTFVIASLLLVGVFFLLADILDLEVKREF
jgi:hypothetical protein